MTELSTQCYDDGNAVVPAVKSGPHWIRSRLIDPATGRTVPAGERGILAHCDLGNFNSVNTILTDDAGLPADGGFLLLGRAEGAQAKGCSLAAGYLPGLAAADVQWQILPFEQDGLRVVVAVPVLTALQMQALAERIKRASAQHLKTMTVSEIIAVIDRAIARLLDPNDPYRRQADALLPIVSGYDAEMVRLGLTGFLDRKSPRLTSRHESGAPMPASA
ncbi:hypothetical protein G6F62_013749 [Rhizopus arrhizus]|nr:hypothetical protein G6F62_013749 [Rhizopus arrhizus]